jgi:predicted ATP-dependent endonuclease of OLD family
MGINLIKFRVQNFRCITDSQWIDVDDVTAFVGINEAGKTALLKGLHTINPGDGEIDLDRIRDFPRDRLTDDFEKNAIVAQANFQIPKKYLIENEIPQKLGLNLEDIKEEGIILELTRKYDKIQYNSFSLIDLTDKHAEKVIELLSSLRKTINRKKIEEFDEESEQKNGFTQENQTKILSLLDEKRIELSDGEKEENQKQKRKETLTLVSGLNQELAQCLVYAKDELEPVLDVFEEIIQKLQGESLRDQLFKLIEDDIPIFIYFEDYNTLEGNINIAKMVKAINGGINYRNLEIQKTLFSHVKLKPHEIYSLGRSTLTIEQQAKITASVQQKRIDLEAVKEQIDSNIDEKALKERKILLDSASQKMTETLNKYFQERSYIVEYNIDKMFLEILISDNIKPSKINLQERSKGFRWYFSFFLVFLVESKGRHKNAILLLDEPGIHLHLEAQFNLINFFNILKETNQIIYTTHSPFLIDEYHLEQVRTVYEEEGVTKVTANNLIPDKKSIFPLQAALSYKTSQSIYQGLKQFLVEGDTDYNYIKGINLLQEKIEKTTLEKDIVIIPCKSASKIEYYARLFRDLENVPVVLVDSDKAGEDAYETLTTSLFADNETNIFQIKDFVSKIQSPEIEDIFDKNYLIKLFNFKNLADKPISVSEFKENLSFLKNLGIAANKHKIKLKDNWKFKLSVAVKNDIDEKSKDDLNSEFIDDFLKIYEKLLKNVNKYAEKTTK